MRINTNFSRRGVLATAGAAGGAALLAACGAQQGSTAQSGTPKGLAPASISWETFRGASGVGTYGDEMVKTFQEKNPNVKVEYRAIGLDSGNQQSAYPKMLAAAQAGTLGDVHAWDPSHWQMYQAVRRGIIQPLDQLIARDKYDLNQFYKQFIEYQKWEGKIWGLPSWGWTSQDGLLYNTELVQQAGVTVPAQNSADWTMAKIYDMIVKVGKFVERTQGFGIKTTMPSATSVTIWARAFDGDNLSADGKKSTMTEANTKAGMRWIYDLANKERVVAFANDPGLNDQTAMIAGKFAFLQVGSLGVFDMNRANSSGSLKFKSTLLPKRKDGKRPSQLRGGTWNMNKVTKAPDAAWAFIQHLSSREGILKFNTIGGNGALVRPDIMTDDYFKDPNFRVFLENFENVMPAIVPANFRGTEFEAAFGTFGTPWYKGEVGFEDGLNTWNTEVQKILDMPPI
ncbi:MAG TPA: extracellular solute-binding protein, partial [Chloroflexota bacterium]|nr:extracellular solute-binding protein [Chloroflexota bacterium]